MIALLVGIVLVVVAVWLFVVILFGIGSLIRRYPDAAMKIFAHSLVVIWTACMVGMGALALYVASLV